MLFGFNEPDVPVVSAEEVFKALEGHKNVVIIDVRTNEEYSRGKIKSSINIPVDQIGNNHKSLPSDKSQKIYVYCLSGARSSVAAEILLKSGYTNVFSMKSGLLAWRVNKYPLDSI